MMISRSNRVTSLPPSTGHPVDFPTPIWSIHQLKRHGKEKIICVGLLANTCLEATARIGMELGFHVTLVRDATSARSHEALHAALEIDGPTYAHEILTTAQLVAAINAPLPATGPAATQAAGTDL